MSVVQQYAKATKNPWAALSDAKDTPLNHSVANARRRITGETAQTFYS